MIKTISMSLCLLLVSALFAVNSGDWQNIRFSGKTAANQVSVRLENTVDPVPANKLLYYNGTAITEQSFSSLNAQTGTMQAQYAPVGSNADLGLIVSGDTVKINPVYYSGTGMPGAAQMTRVSTDPSNDQSTNYLDIISDYFSFSDTKFYAAIQNRGGGFPTGSLFAGYFSYMVIIANPQTAGPDSYPVWALTYMNVPLGGLSPGLYRIEGTERDDLIRFGDIETEIVSGSNLLKMSCNISTLLADPAFAAWYNTADPVLGIISMTSKTTAIPITTTEQDTSPGGNIYPKRLSNPLNPGTLPVLSNFSFNVTPNDIWFQTTYADSYGRFPLTIKAAWQNGQDFILYPQSLDHSQPVIYRSANLIGDLEEYDDVQTFAKASLDNSTYAYSGNPTYSYILGLLPPQNLSLTNTNGIWSLSWNPLVQSVADFDVTPDYFTVEYDSDPYFSAPVPLPNVTGSSVVVDPSPNRRFYRVKAFEQVP